MDLNTTWTTTNFLNYIEHSFACPLVDWYDSLIEEGKNILRMMETPAVIFKNLYKDIETDIYWS